MADSTSTGGASVTLPGPSPASYTLQDWLKVYHHAVERYPRGHPQYAEARSLMQVAMQHIQEMHAHQDSVDQASPPPSKGDALLRGMGQGGLSGFGDELTGSLMAAGGHGTQDANIDFMRQQMASAQKAHPFISGAGDVIGAGLNPLSRLLGPMTAGMTGAEAGATGGAFLGAAHGLGSGTGTAENRVPAGVVGGAAGAVGGAAAGKVLGGIAPKLAKNIASAFGGGAEKAAAEGGEEIVGGIPVSQLRAALLKQTSKSDIAGVSQADRVEMQITKLRQGAPAQAPPQVKGTMGPLTKPAPDPLDRPAFLRAREAAAAKAPTATELHSILATGVASAAPDAAMLSPETQTLRDVAARLGRPLTEQEVEQVLTHLQQTQPHDQSAAARSAYNLTDAAKAGDPRVAARRAAGTYSTWDPRQALAAAPLVGAASTSSR